MDQAGSGEDGKRQDQAVSQGHGGAEAAGRVLRGKAQAEVWWSSLSECGVGRSHSSQGREPSEGR